MNLRQMRYFVAVADELHFGRAAVKLHVVQPAVSQQIRLLEQELGVHLFERSSRRVKLTDAGHAYVEGARATLRQVEHATQAARDAADGLLGSLTIGFVDNAIWSGFPKVIREFGRRVPSVNLVLQQMPRSPQIAALLAGEIDIALAPGPIAHADIETRPFAREPLYAVLPDGHPLAGEEVVAMSALADESFIAIPSPEDPRRINEIVKTMCLEAGFTPRFGQPVQQLLTGISLVSAGLGVMVVPCWMRQAWTDGVVYRQIAPNFDYVLLLATLRRKSRPAVGHFVSIALDLIDQGDTADDRQATLGTAPPEDASA